MQFPPYATVARRFAAANVAWGVHCTRGGYFRQKGRSGAASQRAGGTLGRVRPNAPRGGKSRFARFSTFFCVRLNGLALAVRSEAAEGDTLRCPLSALQRPMARPARVEAGGNPISNSGSGACFIIARHAGKVKREFFPFPRQPQDTRHAAKWTAKRIPHPLGRLRTHGEAAKPEPTKMQKIAQSAFFLHAGIFGVPRRKSLPARCEAAPERPISQKQPPRVIFPLPATLAAAKRRATVAGRGNITGRGGISRIRGRSA